MLPCEPRRGCWVNAEGLLQEWQGEGLVHTVANVAWGVANRKQNSNKCAYQEAV
jgi:hypothetical protein